jgi:hypothetical protein
MVAKPGALLSTEFRGHGQLPNALSAIDIPKHSFSDVDERVVERSENKINLPEMPGACQHITKVHPTV